MNEGFVACEPALDEKRAKAKELGLWSPHLPEELGGMGMPILELALVSEALGRTPIGHYAVEHARRRTSATWRSSSSTARRSRRRASSSRWPRATIRSCFAMTEPEHAGSNPVWMSTTAKVDGDDYVIDGHKWFTTAADGAAFTVVMAVTDPDAPAARAGLADHRPARHARASRWCGTSR